MGFGVSWLNPLTWPIEPWVLLGVEVTAILYLWGAHRRVHATSSSRTRALAFWAGLAVILFAVDTPLETLARQLFWAHMTQHLLLIMVAAPLLVVGAPIGTFIVSTASLWFWHWPASYNLTLSHHLVHHLEHGLFLGFGILFWAQVIDQHPFRARLGALQRAVYVFLGTIQAWALAAVLAFATSPYYAYAVLPSRPGGISALTDQQVGAGIMWVPGSITFSIVFLTCLYLWFREEDLRGRSFNQQPVELVK
jgi:putative membrane protein